MSLEYSEQASDEKLEFYQTNFIDDDSLKQEKSEA